MVFSPGEEGISLLIEQIAKRQVASFAASVTGGNNSPGLCCHGSRAPSNSLKPAKQCMTYDLFWNDGNRTAWHGTQRERRLDG